MNGLYVKETSLRFVVVLKGQTNENLVCYIKVTMKLNC